MYIVFFSHRWKEPETVFVRHGDHIVFIGSVQRSSCKIMDTEETVSTYQKNL